MARIFRYHTAHRESVQTANALLVSSGRSRKDALQYAEEIRDRERRRGWHVSVARREIDDPLRAEVWWVARRETDDPLRAEVRWEVWVHTTPTLEEALHSRLAGTGRV